MLTLITWEYILRVVVAGFCGALIGYERRSRHKEAGIRTHFIVAVGASLMMVISKYGFTDMGDWQNVSLDPSRVASQIVSGVGFLGAGTIFMNKQKVKGLTTAAGIWATAGVGMAVGAGMYVVGIGVTLLILLVQLIMHGRRIPVLGSRPHHLTVRLVNHTDPVENLLEVLEENEVYILKLISQTSEPTQSNSDIRDNHIRSDIELKLVIKFPASMKTSDILVLLHSQPDVRMINLE